MNTTGRQNQLDHLHPQVPVVLPVVGRNRESARMQSLFFPVPRRARAGQPEETSFDLSSYRPGQFLMVWLPGIDEKPYVVSYLGRHRFGITVLERGEFSSALCGLQEGSLVGFRGPYGRGFDDAESAESTALIGGGCGMASLAVLSERLPESTLVQGAPTEDETVYATRFPHQVIFTEDGSAGRRGVPTNWLEEAVAGGSVKRVYTCGPEPMTTRVVRICRRAGVQCQASLERYMKCGIGLCGQCEVDGRIACRDGPVFTAEELNNMPSFGKTTRLKSGKKVSIEGQDAGPKAAGGRP